MRTERAKQRPGGPGPGASPSSEFALRFDLFDHTHTEPAGHRGLLALLHFMLLQNSFFLGNRSEKVEILCLKKS